MPTITLPDGSQRVFPTPVDGLAIARSIGARLERDAVAVRVDGALKDLTLPIEHDARVEIVTRTSPDGLELLRHDAAHVMAEAVKELYPETQVTIGPAIENGFYYDFARSEPFTPQDLERIEKRMHEIVARDEKIVREVWQRDAAVEFFLKQGERYALQFEAESGVGAPAGMIWKRVSRQPLADLRAGTRDADVIVAVVGLTSDLEGEEMPVKIDGFSGGDRTTLDLPADQRAYLRAAAQLGKPLVVVNLSGSAIDLSWAQQHAAAVLQAWYPGEGGGQAIAQVLAGAANPAGRLPVTFYRRPSGRGRRKVAWLRSW